MGSVTLSVIAGEGMMRQMVMTEFVTVDCLGHFNAILGRPFMFKAKAIIFMYHMSMKFQVKKVGKVTGVLITARKYYANSVGNHDVVVNNPREPQNGE